MSSHGKKNPFFWICGCTSSKNELTLKWKKIKIKKNSKMGLVSRLVVDPQDKKVESHEEKKKSKK
jgi:hypothetical protein